MEIKISEEEWSERYYNTELLPLAKRAFELGFFTLEKMLKEKGLSNSRVEKVVQELLDEGFGPILEHLDELAKEDPDEGEELWGLLWECGVKGGDLTPVKLIAEQRQQKIKQGIERAFGPVREESDV